MSKMTSKSKAINEITGIIKQQVVSQDMKLEGILKQNTEAEDLAIRSNEQLVKAEHNSRQQSPFYKLLVTVSLVLIFVIGILLWLTRR